jgi:hypothetical protein
MKIWVAAEKSEISCLNCLHVYGETPERKPGGKWDNRGRLFTVYKDSARTVFPPFIADMRPEDEPVMVFLDIDTGYKEAV